MKGRELFIKALDLSLRKTGLYNAIFLSVPKKSNKKMKFPLPLKQRTLPLASVSIVQPKERAVFGKVLTANVIESMAQSNIPFWKTSWRGFDPKDYWEIARGWHWLPAVLGAKDAAQRQQVLNQICDWLENNPCPNGLAWGVGLDVAVRAINMLMIFSVSSDDRLVPHLSTHLEYLRKMLWLSRHAIRNNHYLGELTAIALLSSAFDENGTKDWKGRLEVELARQFYPDGVNVEQSVRYHLFSLQFALIARIFLGADIPFLEQSGEFLLAAIRPDGNCPSIGDDDSGCVFRLHEEGPSGDFKAMLSILALLCERPDFAFAAGKLFPEADFFLEDARERWSHLESKAHPKKTFIFQDGGFLSSRSNWTNEASYFLIKFGPHKWHAHADLFHVEVSFQGIPVFVDSGTYRYNNVPEKRRYFRSTAAHNTVRFDKMDQSRQFRTFRWLTPAQVTSKEIHKTTEGLSCRFSHSGYESAGIRHERRLDIMEDFSQIRIEDRVLGPGKGPLEIFWHLSPAVEARLISKDLLEITIGSEELCTLTIESRAELSIHITETLWSEAYGHLGNHKTIIASTNKESEKELILVSVIKPKQGETTAERTKSP